MAGKKPMKSNKKNQAKDAKSKAKKSKAPATKAKSKAAAKTKPKAKVVAKAKSAPKAKAKSAAKSSAPARPKGVPPGYRTITPYLVIEGAAAAIDFYATAFGAKENMRMGGPGNKVMHSELQIGDSMLMISDDFPEMAGGQSRSPLKIGNTPVTIHLYVASVDDIFNRAVGAGCQVVMPPADMFWGDRFSCVKDPFGHMWSIATNMKVLTPDEIQAAAAAAFAGGPCGGEPPAEAPSADSATAN